MRRIRVGERERDRERQREKERAVERGGTASKQAATMSSRRALNVWSYLGEGEMCPRGRRWDAGVSDGEVDR